LNLDVKKSSKFGGQVIRGAINSTAFEQVILDLIFIFKLNMAN